MNIRLVIASCIALSCFFMSCQNGGSSDSKKLADEQNDHKEDSGALNKKMDDDAEFLTEVSSGVHMEVELGNYAAKNAASPKVKEFGRRMAADHGKDVVEVQELASKKNITIPTMPGEKFQKHIDDLEKESGAQFDKDYMSYMVSDHKDDIDEFDKEVKNGKDSDIVAFAQKGLPVLHQHLSMAKSIHDGLK